MTLKLFATWLLILPKAESTQSLLHKVAARPAACIC